MSADTTTPAGDEIELKTWPQFYSEVEANRKRYEIRKDDRPFAIGSVLHLREWDPTTGTYTGRECRRIVTYLMRDFAGLAPGHCLMSIKEVPTTPSGDDAAVAILAILDEQERVMPHPHPTQEEKARAILAAIREGRVPGVYHIDSMLMTQQWEAEIAALRAKLAAAEAQADRAIKERDEIAKISGDRFRLIAELGCERDAAIAAKEKAEGELGVERDAYRQLREQTATHRCKVCGAKWRLNPGDPVTYPPPHQFSIPTWSLTSTKCGPCCDNVVMGEQIESIGLTAERDALQARVRELEREVGDERSSRRQAQADRNACEEETKAAQAEVARLQTAGENQCDTFMAIGVALGLPSFDWRQDDIPKEWAGRISTVAKSKMDRIALLDGLLRRVRPAWDDDCYEICDEIDAALPAKGE